MKAITLPATQVNQNGTVFWMTSVPMSAMLPLDEAVVVDEYRPDNPEGYQRSYNKHRAWQFAQFILDGGVSPSSIHLNIREGAIFDDGFLSIQENCEVHVVDGRHRTYGLGAEVEEHPHLVDYEFPTIITSLNRHNEAKQFLICNRAGVGVKADLSSRVMAKMVAVEGLASLVAKREKGILKTLFKDIDWMPASMDIMDRMHTNRQSPLHGMVQMPNCKSTSATPVGGTSFVRSLQPVLDHPRFAALTGAGRGRVIMSYWRTILLLFPEVLIRPKDYALFNYIGLNSMHAVLAELIDRVPRGDSLEEGVAVEAMALETVLHPEGWLIPDGSYASIGSNLRAVKTATLLILGEI